MKKYWQLTNLICILLLMFLCLFPVLAQRKTNKQITKKPLSIIPKSSNTRLTPPLTRKFNHSFELTSDYDKFENSTKVQLRIPINSMESMYLFFDFNGERIKQPPKQIVFQYFGDSGKFFLPVKDFVVLTDRGRFRIKIIQLPELDNGKIPFAAVIDYPTFLRIANGESIEMKIGETELTFDEQSLEALKDFASRTNPNGNRVSEIAETKAVEKEVKDEAAKLLRLTPRVKAKLKQTLAGVVLLQQGIRKAISTNPPDEEGLLLMLQFSATIIKELNDIPEGLFKQLITSGVEDATSSLIISGVRANIFSRNNPSYKTVLEKAMSKYRLPDYPDEEQPLILLKNSEESLYHAETIASAAKIIELEQ
jgi:hypothetical protein